VEENRWFRVIATMAGCLLAIYAGTVGPSTHTVTAAHAAAKRFSGPSFHPVSGTDSEAIAAASPVGSPLAETGGQADRPLDDSRARAVTTAHPALSPLPIPAQALLLGGLLLSTAAALSLARRRRGLADFTAPFAALAAELGVDRRYAGRAGTAAALFQIKAERQRLHLVARARNLEARLLSTRMAELEKAKVEFLKVASHELRAPLTVLQGYVSMLEEGALGELPDAMRPVVPIIGAKLGEMNLLVDQMLETARLEDSYLPLRMCRVDLGALLEEAVLTMRPLARGGSIGFERPPAPTWIHADGARVVTVLINLLDNAIKYSEPAGEIGCELTAGGGMAVIAIKDRGLGIRAEDMPTLFTRFGRIVTPQNSHIPGTGLGLYLSRELAHLHRGDVTARSRLGEGSTFLLTLPLLEPAG
jgi:signal transduction histidine kinase